MRLPPLPSTTSPSIFCPSNQERSSYLYIRDNTGAEVVAEGTNRVQNNMARTRSSHSNSFLLATALTIALYNGRANGFHFQHQQRQQRKQYELITKYHISNEQSEMNPTSFLLMTATNKNEQQTSATSSSASRSDKKKETAQKEDHDMFQDGRGHINPELARLIYKWEQDQRLTNNLPKFQYSTREGLRWVLDSVPSYDEDLMQEGVIALMQAMTEFERKAPSKVSFEAYCKHSIQLALNEYRRTAEGDKDSPARRKAALSVESTVQIDDPLETHFVNEDEWEVREGLVLDNGNGVKAEESVEDFLDENLQYEGEDQMWVQQQQVAAPLTHSIPDDDHDNDNDVLILQEEDPDDRFLADMIRYDVDEFLGSTLDELESQVIQMRFGLGEEALTQKQAASELGLGVARIRKLQKTALEKLRNAYQERYMADDDEEDWEDSV